MSPTVRWILAIVTFVLGLAIAAFVVFGGAFSTVACVAVPPDWVYYVVILVGILIVVAAAFTSLQIVRGRRPLMVLAPVLIGAVLTCVGLVAYYTLLGQYC